MVSRARVRIFTTACDRVAEEALVEKVDEALELGAEAARGFVPVDTGDLQADIDVIEGAHVEGGGVVGRYGVTGVLTDYGEHVEFGTSKSPAQPYIRPSIDAMKRGLT